MIPALQRAAWEQAEAQLYQVVMTRPELYQRAVVLAAALSAALERECPDPAALVARAGAEEAAGWPLVQRVADETLLPLGGIDPARAGRAGCAMAARVLVLVQARADRRDRLALARSEGREWVVVEESGDPAGVPWAPYRRVEVRSGSGRGVLVSTEPDEDLAGVLHRVLPAAVDPDTGELVVAPDAEDPVLPDAAAREAKVERLRAATI